MRIHNFLRDYLIYLANFFMFLQPWEISVNSQFLRELLIFATVFGNSPWNHYLFCEFHFEFTIFFFESTLNQLFLQCKSSIFLANYVWIHNDSRESLFVCSLSYSLSFLQFHLKLTIFFAKSLSYQLYFFLFHFSLRPQYKSSIFIGKLLDIFENPLWIDKLFREFTLSFTTNWVSIDERWNVWNFYELM